MQENLLAPGAPPRTPLRELISQAWLSLPQEPYPSGLAFDPPPQFSFHNNLTLVGWCVLCYAYSTSSRLRSYDLMALYKCVYCYYF